MTRDHLTEPEAIAIMPAQATRASSVARSPTRSSRTTATPRLWPSASNCIVVTGTRRIRIMTAFARHTPCPPPPDDRGGRRASPDAPGRWSTTMTAERAGQQTSLFADSGLPVIYEQPLNERIRNCLRLEHLFTGIDAGIQGGTEWDARAALKSGPGSQRFSGTDRHQGRNDQGTRPQRFDVQQSAQQSRRQPGNPGPHHRRHQ